MNVPLAYRLVPRWLGLVLGLSTTAALWADNNVTVTNTTYSSTTPQTVSAVDTLTTSGSVIVTPSANVTFVVATTRIQLNPGFHAQANSRFRAVIPAALAILSGNNQTAPAGQFNAAPFDIAAYDGSATVPLEGAPITFTVSSGGGQLALSNTGNPVLSSVLTVFADYAGTAKVYYKHMAGPATASVVRVTAGAAELWLNTSSTKVVDPNDQDEDGMPDTWEQTYFGGVGATAGGNPDGDVLTNLEEYQAGTNPTSGDVDLVLRVPDGSHLGLIRSTWQLTALGGA